MPQLVKLIADIALFDPAGRALLVRYGDINGYDHQPGWFLPDDALAEQEHPDDAARRILQNQLGLEALLPVLDQIESFVGRDRSWHMVFHYRAALANAAAIAPARDIAEAGWFSLDALPPSETVAHGGWALYVLERIGDARELVVV